jgi:adenine-specific DNA-methyltransferase
VTYTLHCGDCLDILPTLADNSVDLIATDPPYYKVKGEQWDRQWETPEGFLSWLDSVLAELYRVLKPNGSLYMFASPKMAARVEVLIAQRFNVLNRITWQKPPYSTKAEMFDKAIMRAFFPASEAIIFAEHYGAEGYAKGEAGYSAKCDELRGFVFEPLRAYLAGERDRAGATNPQINAAWCEWKGVNSTSQTQKWFSDSCFNPPTQEAYLWLRQTLSQLNHGGQYLRREYEDLRREYEDLRREYEDLRREYEDLRREYEDLRRPFNVSADVPYTDVWTFKTVNAYPGKHPTEKPLAMMKHIIAASSREGATVLDCFMGGGTTGKAAQHLGRNFIGIEKDAKYFAQARQRIESVQPALMAAD